MTELLIRDLPSDVEARLRQRAEQAGRTLEDEVRAVLCADTKPGQTVRSNTHWVGDLLHEMVQFPLTQEDWAELDRSLDAVRSSRSDSLHRWIDFSDAQFDQ